MKLYGTITVSVAGEEILKRPLPIAVPEANPTLSLTAALGNTFPFNIAIGIPIYLEPARQLS